MVHVLQFSRFDHVNFILKAPRRLAAGTRQVSLRAADESIEDAGQTSCIFDAVRAAVACYQMLAHVHVKAVRHACAAAGAVPAEHGVSARVAAAWPSGTRRGCNATMQTTFIRRQA